MRRAVYMLMAVAAVVAVASCGKKGPEPAAIAAHAAKGYYDQLLRGDYKAFVDGTYRPERIPESYRQQLEANAKMFVAQQQEEHSGLKGSVAFSRCMHVPDWYCEVDKLVDEP